MNHVISCAIVILAMVIPCSGYAQAISTGKQLYEQTCAACHQQDGSGVPTLAPPLHHDLWKKLGADAPSYIAHVMLSGMAGIELDGESYYAAMPGWSSMSDADIAAIGNYVLSDLNGVDARLTPELIASWRTKPITEDQLKMLRGRSAP